MLVVLPHGFCVDPEIVKYLTIRVDRPQQPNAKLMFSVVMKTDADENQQMLGTFVDRAEAEALTTECARRLNKGLGVDTDDSSGSDDSSDSDDDASEDSDAEPAAADADWDV
jgi:hypothetical protein